MADKQLVGPKQVGVGGGTPALLSFFAGLGRRMLKGFEEKVGSRVVWIIGGRTRSEVPDASGATARRPLEKRG